MRRFLAASLSLKILLPALVIALLGITPQMHAASEAMHQARFAFDNGSPAIAAAHLERAISVLPWRTDLWEIAGQYALQGEDTQHALEYFQRAAGAHTLSAQGYLSLGDAYRKAGDLTGALDAWGKALEGGIGAILIYNRFLEVHQQKQDLTATLADLQALAQLKPSDAEIYYQLGLYQAALQPDAAPAYLLRAAELDPALSADAEYLRRSIETAHLSGDLAYSLVASGRALASLGEWQLAAEAFHRATLERPDFAPAWAYFGEALQHIDLPKSSEDDSSKIPVTSYQTTVNPAGFVELQKALSIDPTSVPANTMMALYWQRQERYDLALSYLDQAATLDPKNPAILSEIGNTHALSGDLEQAMHSYQQAIQIAPSDPAYWIALAQFTITNNYQLRETGLPAARQAVLTAPDDPASLDTLAQVFIQLGDSLSALRFLGKAIEKDPNYAAAHLHLGLIYQFEGKTTLAYRQFSLAKSLARPGSAISNQSQRLLQRYFDNP